MHSYKMSIPKRLLVLALVGITLLSAFLIRATPAHAAIPPGTAQEISFGLDPYSHYDQGVRYVNFLQQLRDLVAVRSRDGGLQTQNQNGDEAYAVVHLYLTEDPEQQVYLYVRANDLYVVGFSTGAALFRLRDEHLEHSTELQLGGNYVQLTAAAGRGIPEMQVTRGNVEQSIRDLHAVTAGTFTNRRMDTARALQQLIQMVSEGARFDPIASVYANEIGGRRSTPEVIGNGRFGLEHSWSALSRYIYEGRTNRITAGNYTFQGAAEIRRRVRILLGHTAGYGDLKHDEL